MTNWGRAIGEVMAHKLLAVFEWGSSPKPRLARRSQIAIQQHEYQRQVTPEGESHTAGTVRSDTQTRLLP